MSRIAIAGSILGLVSVLVLPISRSMAQDARVPPPRAGLSAEQSQDARRIAVETFKNLRPNPEAVADARPRDPREYVVGVELMTSKTLATEKPAGGGTRAVVTSYRYADDATILAVVDLETGKVVDVQTALHLRTALSDAEYAEAQVLAREQSPEVKTLFEKIGPEKIDVYPQYSQFTLPGEPRIHRMIQLTYRVNGRDLSAPRPFVDLTSREVRIPNRPKQPRD